MTSYASIDLRASNAHELKHVIRDANRRAEEDIPMTSRNPFASMRVQGDPAPSRHAHRAAPWDDRVIPPPSTFPLFHGVQPHAGLWGAMEPNDMDPSKR